MSVVMPVLNEERHLRDAVTRILTQDYPGPMEVVIALGPSRDRTDEVAAELVAADPRVRTVSNPSGRTPCALNAALAGSANPVVVRVDGHGLLTEGYVRTAVDPDATGAANVGGIMAAELTPSPRPWRGLTPGSGSVARFHTGGAGRRTPCAWGVPPRC